MIFPDKLITFHDSIMARSIFILQELENKSISISELFEKVKTKFEDISDFILALDVLFILNKIKFNEELQVMEYVKTNNM